MLICWFGSCVSSLLWWFVMVLLNFWKLRFDWCLVYVIR